MTYPVKNFRHTQVGIPQITGQPGSFIAALDAFLLTGFNIGNLDALSISGSVATATRNGHGFRENDIVLHTAGTAKIEAKIYNVSSTQYQFTVSAADAAALAGTVEARIAPQGSWEKVFSAGNVAVYRSKDSAGLRHFFKVDDGAAQYAYVTLWESMTDVANGSNRVPTTSQLVNGLAFRKSSTSDAAARPYRVYADARTLYFYSAWLAGNGYHAAHGFGELIPFKPGDAGHSFIAGSSTTSANAPADGNQFSLVYPLEHTLQLNSLAANNYPAAYLLKDHTGLATGYPVNVIGHAHYGNAQGGYVLRPQISGAGSFGPSGTAPLNGIPSAIDEVSGGPVLRQLELGESYRSRGLLPGLFQHLHARPYSDGQIIVGAGAYSGRRFEVVNVSGYDHYNSAWSWGQQVISLDAWM
jgi:hypothetical protein